MRALTLWQPYASLVAGGAKQWETRHWATGYRGLLAIHAASRWTANERYLTEDFRQRFGVTTQDCKLDPPPLGAVVCVVRLVDVVPTVQVRPVITQAEKAFGNWATGRYAWKLELEEVFATPFSAKGRQNFFNWERPGA